MACFWFNEFETKIKIIAVEEISNVNYYKIQVWIGDYCWIVSHRYNDFYELHNQLVLDYGISKDILPSKKVRNKCPTFIEQRRNGLEEYLFKVLVYLERRMPRIFVEFLDFHLYDIYFLLQDLAQKLFVQWDHVLASSKLYSFTPLELHAISECLKKPFPVPNSSDTVFDISSILDLCSQLITLKVNGSSSSYRDSNIELNKLPFELSSFKILHNLMLHNVSLDMIKSLGSLRNTLKVLRVHKTRTKNFSQILQCDVLHKNNVEGSAMWTAIETLDFSNNNLIEIDQTVNLAPNVNILIIDNNFISSIPNLSHLANLSFLSISNNLLTVCNDLHIKFGKIVTINMAQNSIRELRGFAKLYSLENLDLSCNKISNIDEIAYISDLPCLENLVLTGNDVAAIVDYRIKVFDCFGERAKDLCLDNEKASQSELDKVSVLRALRIVKEGKKPNLTVLSIN